MYYLFIIGIIHNFIIKYVGRQKTKVESISGKMSDGINLNSPVILQRFIHVYAALSNTAGNISTANEMKRGIIFSANMLSTATHTR